jgi:hypothetical protein
MLGAQLAPWRLWRSGLGRNGICACGQFGLRVNQVTGAQGPQENCDNTWNKGSCRRGMRSVWTCCRLHGDMVCVAYGHTTTQSHVVTGRPSSQL